MGVLMQLESFQMKDIKLREAKLQVSRKLFDLAQQIVDVQYCSQQHDIAQCILCMIISGLTHSSLSYRFNEHGEIVNTNYLAQCQKLRMDILHIISWERSIFGQFRGKKFAAAAA